ncbi:MAG: ABC transporter substrate-binding protein [Eubacterium sp.]|jgi:iron complex transport system substrate-binding protein|nr:ABC transporter substrate-binding protein [Eubacterium sp.]
MNKRILTVFIATVILLMAVGCEKTENTVSLIPENERLRIYFLDDEGQEINLDKPCSRIISMYSAHTENLYEIGAEKFLIGNYSTGIYPPEAALLPTFNYNGDPEAVIAADPDCVIIRPFISEKAPDWVSAVKRAGILVVSFYPENLEEFPEYIRKLAMLTGLEESASQKLELFISRIDKIKSITVGIPEDKRQTVFFESTETNIRTVTPESMPGQAIAFAGGINIASDVEPMSEGSTIATFGEEKIFENADNIDVYISQRGAMNAGGNLTSINERRGWDAVKAIKNNRVCLINEKLISSPTFRYYKGVNEIARFLYPDIMDDLSLFDNDNYATKRSFANIVIKSLHLPIYVPSSSKYYDTEQKGHTYGRLSDVNWQDEDFDYIETVIYSGIIGYERDSSGNDLFHPESDVTKDELAMAIFMSGNFKANEKENIKILDLEQCENQRIVQTLVNNGIFELNQGRFNPKDVVTNHQIIEAFKKLEIRK